MRSYAEHEVDLIVYEAFFDGVRDGVMVEVGAAGPELLSMSLLFRQAGWRVILVEPNPVFAEMHRQAGHQVFEVACADRDADDVPFVVVDSHETIYEGVPVTYESLSALEIKAAYRAVHEEPDLATIRVSVRRLDTLLDAEENLDRLDVLSVDVEGWELEVLAGFSFDRYRPGVVIVENLFADPAYTEALYRAGYQLWRRIPPNDVYVRRPGSPG